MILSLPLLLSVIPKDNYYRANTNTQKSQSRLYSQFNYIGYRERRFLDLIISVKIYTRELSIRESGGKPSIVNKIGCIGKYQICPVVIRSFKQYVKREYNIKVSITRRDLIRDTILQDIIFHWHNQMIIKKIEHVINNGYVDTNRLKDDFYGYMAVGHLCGTGGLIGFVKYGKNPKDIFGTSCRDYYTQFSNMYDIEYIRDIYTIGGYISSVVDNGIRTYVLEKYAHRK